MMENWCSVSYLSGPHLFSVRWAIVKIYFCPRFTLVMTKILLGSVLLLLRVCPTQLNSAAMLLSQLTVSSVWCWTIVKISSYWSLDTSSSWETSSSSRCSSRTLGHSEERKWMGPDQMPSHLKVRETWAVWFVVVAAHHLWARLHGRLHIGSVIASTRRTVCEGPGTTSCSAGNGRTFPSLQQEECS